MFIIDILSCFDISGIIIFNKFIGLLFIYDWFNKKKFINYVCYFELMNKIFIILNSLLKGYSTVNLNKVEDVGHN